MTKRVTSRWYSLTLRTLLIGVTLICALCARYNYCRQKRAEHEQLETLLDGHVFSYERRDSLGGWDLPEVTYDIVGQQVLSVDKLYLLRLLAVPRLQRLELCAHPGPLTAPLILAARRVPELAFSYFDVDDGRQLIERGVLFSEHTRKLRIEYCDLTQSLELSRATNLQELDLDVDLSPCVQSDQVVLASVVTHPSLESLKISGESKGLARLQVDHPIHFSGLEVSLSDNIMCDEVQFSESDYAFSWLRNCERLKLIKLGDSNEMLAAAFLRATGEQLEGVATLRVEECRSLGNDRSYNDGRTPARLIDCLASWRNLRHLEIIESSVRIDDDFFTKLHQACPRLESLEIEQWSRERLKDSLAAINSLRGINRLRIDFVELTPQHIAAIAELGSLSELSLSGTDALSEAALRPLQKLNLRILHGPAESQTPWFRGSRDDWYPPEPRGPCYASPIPVVG